MRPSLVTARWPGGGGGSNTPRVCQLSQLRSPVHRAAKCSFTTLGSSPPRARHPQCSSDRGLFLWSTVPSIRAYRFAPAKTSKPPVTAKAKTVRKEANASDSSHLKTPSNVKTEASPLAPDRAPDHGPPLSADEQAALLALDRAKDQLLARGCVPDEQEVLSLLRTCEKLASSHKGKSVRHGSKMRAEPDTSASSLLSLDGAVTGRTKATATAVSNAETPSHLDHHISQVAFDIVCHPTVVITPQILDVYVGIQGLLGDPDTLPYVLELYASKPKPQASAGSLEYLQRNRNAAANAIDPVTAEKALGIAIEAKNLDAAVGIVANTYGSKAFLRQKMLRKALLPATAVAAMPFAVWLVASRLAKFQQLYDDQTATAMAAAGLLVYVSATGFMGALAVFTHNDQMNRVTWAPGMRLFSRWLREEERAGLDRVACAFGFSEVNRRGEEEGTDFESLGKYILLRGMVLDRVESMPGMK